MLLNEIHRQTEKERKKERDRQTDHSSPTSTVFTSVMVNGSLPILSPFYIVQCTVLYIIHTNEIVIITVANHNNINDQSDPQ